MRPNLPNSISLFRVLMVPLLMVFLLVDIPGGRHRGPGRLRGRGGERLAGRLSRPPPASDRP